MNNVIEKPSTPTSKPAPRSQPVHIDHRGDKRDASGALIAPPKDEPADYRRGVSAAVLVAFLNKHGVGAAESDSLEALQAKLDLVHPAKPAPVAPVKPGDDVRDAGRIGISYSALSRFLSSNGVEVGENETEASFEEKLNSLPVA